MNLEAYVPRLLVEWLTDHPDRRHLAVDGTLAFVDISGFTTLTERLARKGRIGAEEMSDVLDGTFGALLDAAEPDGADLVKWGGDAILLLFRGTAHAEHATRAAGEMRRTLRRMGGLSSSAGELRLRMSVGIHSGAFHFFLVGDPEIHRELIVTGPAASRTAELESVASAGQIAVSTETAGLLPGRLLGIDVPGGRLLSGMPRPSPVTSPAPRRAEVDLAYAIPVALREHLRAAAGVSEHRQIAVGFVEFSGTDALLDELGPEAVAAALDEFIRSVQVASATHDVTFLESDINRDGGKVLLVAGAPRSRGEHEDRLLHALRQIIDRSGRLRLRAGVNRGGVYAGDFGPPARRTYSVKGDAVNLAARVMGKAEPGQLLATTDVVARARTLFDATELPPFPVKGKSRLVNAVAVGAVGAQRMQDLSAGDFVGREAEMLSIAGALDGARRLTGSVVEVVGDAGIGKSRLVHEVRRLADDLVSVEAPSGSYTSNTAYHTFRSLLRGVLEVPSDAPPATIGAVLVGRVERDAPTLVPWLSLLGVVAGVELPATRETEELDERFRRPKVEEVTVQLLRELLPTPSLLVFENTQLMDDASADLLSRLVGAVESAPWVVLTTRRPQESGFVAPSTGGLRLVLSPIEDRSALELLESITASARLTPRAMEVIAAKAGGNPLFLRALVLAATRSGSIADLPESVEDVVTTQIDRLDPADRALLRYASVFGMQFSVRRVRDLLAARGLATDDDVLQRVRVFVEPVDADRCRFQHAVIRDVAYGGLPYRLRRQIHDEVGAALERSVRTDGRTEELSMHFFHAGNHQKAWTYSRAAADRASGKYAYVEAMEFLERALECRTRATEVSPEDVVAVYEQLGDVRDIAGLSSEAADAYRRAQRFVGQDGLTRATLLFKEASIAQRMGRFSFSLGLLSRGRHLLDPADGADVDAARSRLATRYSFGRYLQGRYVDAVRWSAVGIDEARRAGDQSSLAYAYNTAHLAYLHAGRDEEEPYGELALAAYEKIGDLRMQGHCLNNLAIGAFQDGRWGLSAELLDRAGALFGRVGDTTNEANTGYNRADLLIQQGRFDEAERQLAVALRASRAVDDPELEALVLREQGRTLTGLGRWDEAMARFDDARARLSDLGLRQEVVSLDAARSECLMNSGRLDDGLVMIASALEQARAERAGSVLATLLRIQAFGLAALGRYAEARSSLDQGLAAVDHGDGTYERALMLLAAARLSSRLRRRPDVDNDRQRHEGQQILDRLGVVDVPGLRLLDET